MGASQGREDSLQPLGTQLLKKPPWGRSPEGPLSTSEVTYSLRVWPFPLLGPQATCSNAGLSQRDRRHCFAPSPLSPALPAFWSTGPSRGESETALAWPPCCALLSPRGARPWTHRAILPSHCLWVSPGWRHPPPRRWGCGEVGTSRKACPSDRTGILTQSLLSQDPRAQGDSFRWGESQTGKYLSQLSLWTAGSGP